MNERVTHLLHSMDLRPTRMESVSGGDINDSYRVTSKEGTHYFVKINRFDQSKQIITAEARGIEMMRSAGVSMLPGEVRWSENAQDALLIMPFYAVINNPSSNEWRSFFRELALMHRISQEDFGGEDNFIGLLPQDNTSRNNWVPFYRENRLRPQLKLAFDKEYFTSSDVKTWDRLFENLPEFMPIERPSLVHGDLWSGNIISTREGILLIDPCPYYGHREMDFGMMELFSGFPIREHLAVYEDVYPLTDGLFERIELYQLYYLLVHLNLFGTAYLPGVQRIIKKFSG